MDYVVGFEQIDKDAVQAVGGKNASIGEMIRAGIRVPPGFAVTTESYLRFITETGVTERLYPLLSGLDPEDVGALNRVSVAAQELILQAPVPDELQEAIQEGYSRLCRRCMVDAVPVAVRSSATAEDLPTASFAGQQESYLWIQGGPGVLDHVHKCWASLFTPRAVSYRIKNGFAHEKVLISVGVQEMVNARAAGVMFTLNPTNGDLSKVVIEGSWGLGETVVSGSVNPDKFVVDKVVLETTEKTVSSKHIACVYDPDEGRVVDRHIAPDKQSQCCLEDREIKELVRVAKAIETHYGRPMDIEWAIDKDLSFPDNLFIVQARPETVWSRRKEGSVLGRKRGYELLLEQAMKRIRVRN